jgi:hypothetical protein
MLEERDMIMAEEVERFVGIDWGSETLRYTWSMLA